MEKTCRICHKTHEPVLSLEPDFPAKYLRWRNGELVQNVWPNARPIEREQLQTGICSDECWDKLFQGEPKE